MPGSKRVITVEGSFEQVYYYEQDCIAQVAALITPCAPDGLGHDIKGALVEEAAKAAAVLDRLSIGEAPKASGGSGGSVGLSI